MSFIKKYFYLINGFSAFIIYLLTIAPSVVQIDSGELATVQYTLGIAHPTGYPLYTILGFLFSKIPLPISKILQLNILASLYCAIAVSIFSYTAKILLDNINLFIPLKTTKEKAKKKRNNAQRIEITKNGVVIPETIKILISVISGLFLAFSKTFWMQSTSVEVYSLHLLLINLIILFLLKAFVHFEKDKFISKYWMLFALTLALGFSNHMTTILILPGTAYIYFTQNGFNKNSFKQIGFMLLLFIPFLILIYAYLPIRSSQNPILNWGNPTDLERIIRHITGKQYQVWLFSSTEAASKQFAYFLSNLPSEFIIYLIIIFLGVFASFVEAKKLFLFLIITFLSTVLYSINYDISDIDSYFLLAYISLAYFGMFGIYKLFKFSFKRKIKPIYPIILLAVVLGLQFNFNYPKVNQKQNYLYEDYSKAVLNSVPKNSIIFTYQWDYLVSPSYYFQYVENYRKDVTIIDKELLRRSWYYNQLNTNQPFLLNGIRSDVSSFLGALAPFERGENFNPSLLENLYRKIMTELISSNILQHDYFIAPELVDNEMRKGEFQLPKNYTIVPYSLLYKVVNTNEYVEAPSPVFVIRFPDNKDKYALALENIIGNMLVNRAMYELKFNRTDLARTYIKKVATECKDFTLSPQLQTLIND
jgi:hypothetical protein